MHSLTNYSNRYLRTLLLITMAAIPGYAQQPELAPEKRSQIEAAASRFLASTHVPGVSVAIVENAVYAWAAGFGMADLENNVPAS